MQENKNKNARTRRASLLWRPLGDLRLTPESPESEGLAANRLILDKKSEFTDRPILDGIKAG